MTPAISRCVAFGFVWSLAFASLHAAPEPVSLTWLGNPSQLEMKTGVSWGVPWPKGAVAKNQSFALRSADGKTLPLQTWPLAYWPDGSLKWSGFATVARPETNGTLQLSVTGAPGAEGAKLTLT